jgi:inhibitor of cysteine peptidase
MKYLSILVFLWIGFLNFQQGTMIVKSGEIFKIVLESNRSTGYGWYWDNKPDKSIIDSLYVDYVLKSKMQTGAGGNEMWEFRALRKGEQMIKMVYKRPWENKPPLKSKEILIKVN